MGFGKREQIIIGAVVAVILIAALHITVFAPRAAAFSKAMQDRDMEAEKIQRMRIVKDPQLLDRFEKESTDRLAQLQEGIKHLGLNTNEIFIMAPKEKSTSSSNENEEESESGYSNSSSSDDEDYDKELEGDATGSGTNTRQQTTTEEEKTQRELTPDELRKKAEKEAEVKKKVDAQTDLIMAEIALLMSLRGDPANPSQTQTSFLDARGWNLPVQLPDTMNGPALWDQLRQIADIKNALDRMSKTARDYQATERRYSTSLRPLGIDVVHMNQRLQRYGEFVGPFFFRMAYAHLILERLKAEPTPVFIAGKQLDRDEIFIILGIKIPDKRIRYLEESRYYFVYEELKNLNNLIKMAKNMQVADISSVTFRGFAFLKEQGARKAARERPITDIRELGNDEADAATEEGAARGGGAIMPGIPGMPGVGMPGVGMPGVGIPGVPGMPGVGGLAGYRASLTQAGKTKPLDKEIGYALPIKITIKANNNVMYNYIWDVLRDNPLAELHRLVLKSDASDVRLRDPGNPNIEASATFIFVPKLFDTIESVREVLNELNGTSDTQSVMSDEASE